MLNKYPVTYNEAMLLSRCYEVKKYAPSITIDTIQAMYNFLSESPSHQIGLSNGMLYFQDAYGQSIDAYSVSTTPGFEQLLLSTSTFRVVNTSNGSSSHSSNDYYSNYNNNMSEFSKHNNSKS